MHKQKIITYLCLLGATMTIASCNSKDNPSTSNSSNVETSISDEQSTTSSQIESSTSKVSDSTTSVEDSSTSSSEVITEYTVSFDYNGAYDNETITYKKGDVIDLSSLTFINDSYDCFGWTDGTNEYDVDDKITVTQNMNLVGNYMKKSFDFELSSDKTYYVAARYIDSDTTEVVVPETYRNLPVKAIKEGAFDGASYITKLTIGDNIMTIAPAILEGLTNLETLVVPFFGSTIDDTDVTFGYLFGMSGGMQVSYVPWSLKEVTITKQEVIPQEAFYNLPYIETIHLGNAVTIKENAFYTMKALTTVDLNEGVEILEDRSFCSLPNLTKLDLPSTVRVFDNAIDSTKITSLHFTKALEEYTFENYNLSLESIVVDADNELFTSVDGVLYNKDLTTLLTYPSGKEGSSFTILDSVTKIENLAFRNANITSIDLKNVEVIGNQAFYCSKLSSVSFPSTIREIGKTSFSYSPLETVTFPEALTKSSTIKLGDFTFSSCEKISSLTIPSYIDTLPRYFVAGGYSLTSVKFLGSLAKIEERAFAETAIKELEITLKDDAKLGDYIFINCSKIETLKLHFEDNVVNYPSFDKVGFGSGWTPTIICDNEAVATKLQEKWPDYKSFISTAKSSPFVIENNVLIKFNGTSEDKNVTIPEGIVKIATGAFTNEYVQSITLPSSIETIEADAFKSCSSLRYVRFLKENPGSTIKILNNGQESSINSYSWPINILFIVNNSNDKTDLKSNFSSIYKKQSVFAADEVVISSKMIISADGTTLIRGYETVDGVFDVPSTVTTIYPFCFYENSELTTFDFTNIETIGDDAFECTSLVNLVLPESVTFIGESSFASIETLLSIKIEGAITISYKAFDSDTYLESIDLGNSVVSIGDNCFALAGSEADNPMELVIIPSSVEELGEAVFEDANISTIQCEFSEGTFDDETVFDNFGGEVTYTE